MRHLVAFGCFLAVLILAPVPAGAEGTRAVDLVVREIPPGTHLDLSTTPSEAPVVQPPAKPMPLHLRLDTAGRLELLLRVSPDQFMGKLAFAL